MAGGTTRRRAVGVVAAQMIEPIRVTETLKPIAITEPKPGVFIFDLGQNMVGWCRLKVSGAAGTQVSLRHAETLKPDGTLYMANLRGARVTDTYTLRGGGAEIWEPRFTYHGFRLRRSHRLSRQADARCARRPRRER